MNRANQLIFPRERRRSPGVSASAPGSPSSHIQNNTNHTKYHRVHNHYTTNPLDNPSANPRQILGTGFFACPLGTHLRVPARPSANLRQPKKRAKIAPKKEIACRQFPTLRQFFLLAHVTGADNFRCTERGVEGQGRVCRPKAQLPRGPFLLRSRKQAQIFPKILSPTFLSTHAHVLTYIKHVTSTNSHTTQHRKAYNAAQEPNTRSQQP